MTNYDRQGSGAVIVLVHGWGDTLKTFDELAAQLMQKHDVVRVDLPGFGGTEAPKQVWNLDNYAQFLSEFLAKIGVHDYVLVGHSNGGAVIIRGVSMGVLKPQKIVLLAASGVRTGGGLRRLLLKIIAKVGKVLTFWLPTTVLSCKKSKAPSSICHHIRVKINQMAPRRPTSHIPYARTSIILKRFV